MQDCLLEQSKAILAPFGEEVQFGACKMDQLWSQQQKFPLGSQITKTQSKFDFFEAADLRTMFHPITTPDVLQTS